MKLENALIKEFEAKFLADSNSNVIKNAIAKNGIMDASFNNDVLRVHDFKFSNEVKTGEITNQESTGRCWIFASLNMARIKTMNVLKIKDFEYSENYFLFWEKMEKANTFFENIIQHGLDLEQDDRLLKTLLSSPVDDGGYWEWFASLIRKYGVVPKEVMPETYHSAKTGPLNVILNKIAIRAAVKMRNSNKTKKVLNVIKNEALYQIYNVCVKALGMPPKTFDFAYHDKDDKFHKIENMTPIDFFNKYVGDELDHKISIVSDPREIYPYGKVLESKYHKTVIEGYTNRCLNVPIQELKRTSIASIKDNKGVWFACDVGQYDDRKIGILDSNLYNFDQTLVAFDDLSKADRLAYGLIYPNHAMTFIGVDLDKNNKPLKWKVENSWGEKSGNKGIFSMTDQWFDDYNFECVVDKKYIDPKYLKGLEEEPIMLEPWDPMA